MCRKCGKVAFGRDGSAIVIDESMIKYEVMGSVKVTCSCGNVFRKSAGFIKLLPLIDRWVKDGTVARGGEQPERKESVPADDNLRGTDADTEQPGDGNRNRSAYGF